MASSINASLTAGIVQTADTSGNLNLQSGGTTIVAITSSGAAITGALSSTSGATIQGLTVGLGGGALTYNTALGVNALSSGSLTGNYNTAAGYGTLPNNTSGALNVAFGVSTLATNTTGSSNSGLGTSSLNLNTTGSYNTAVGADALRSNTTASNNTAIGYQAGYTSSTGANFAYFGYQAGYAATGSAGTFLGFQAGLAVTTGASNTFVGAKAGEVVTTGAANTILGRYNGNQGGLDIRTASNYIVLSDGDGNPRAFCTPSGVFSFPQNFLGSWQGSSGSNTLVNDGAQFYPSTDNTLKLGYPSFRWTTVYATTALINTSDANQKQQILDLNEAEKAVAKRIKSLIKTFKFNDSVAEKGDKARIHIGVIAQEVQSAFIAEGLDPNKYAMFCSDTWYEVDGKPKNDDGFYTKDTLNAIEVTRLGIRYDQLLAFVISTL
jgi:hypothetical protein